MTDKKTLKIDTMLEELKQATTYFLQAKKTIKDKDNYLTFIFNTARRIYLEGGKNKTGFLYAFFEAKLYPYFKQYGLENGVLFGSYNKGKSIYLMQESEDCLEKMPDYSDWINEKRQAEKSERLEKQEKLLKKDFKTFDLSRIKTVEEVDYYLLKLKQVKKDLESQVID